MSYIKSLLLMFLVIMLIAACSVVPSNQFVGKWVREGGGDVWFQFNEDSTGTWNNRGTSVKCRYELLDDGRLRIDFKVFGISTGEVYKVSLDENIMTLTNSKNKTEKYIRAGIGIKQ